MKPAVGELVLCMTCGVTYRNPGFREPPHEHQQAHVIMGTMTLDAASAARFFEGLDELMHPKPFEQVWVQDPLW